jgi:hypothetical protein
MNNGTVANNPLRWTTASPAALFGTGCKPVPTIPKLLNFRSRRVGDLPRIYQAWPNFPSKENATPGGVKFLACYKVETLQFVRDGVDVIP